MKMKTVVAAVAAMFIGCAASASTCVDSWTTEKGTACVPQALVYSWQFKGKACRGVIVTTEKGGLKSSGSSCTDAVTAPGVSEVIRIPGSLVLVGWSYLCDAECYTIQSALMNPTKAQFYSTKPVKSLVTPYRGKNFITSVDVANVIGKNASQYELAGEAEMLFDSNDSGQVYKIRFAGFGSYDKSRQCPTSVCGTFAGIQTVPRCLQSVNGVRCPGAGYWDCCSLTYAGGSDAAPSVAYGTWSMNLNSAASKRVATGVSSYWAK